MRAALTRRDDVAEIPDGARTQQQIPVRFSGLDREGSRHHQNFRTGLRQRAIQPGEAHVIADRQTDPPNRSEEHTSELQSLMRTSYAVFCLKKKKTYRLELPATLI